MQDRGFGAPIGRHFEVFRQAPELFRVLGPRNQGVAILAILDRNRMDQVADIGTDAEILPMPRIENDHVVESTTEARAGVTGHNVRYVLLISTLAVIALFTVAYIATKW